jgi:hypothetical protein
MLHPYTIDLDVDGLLRLLGRPKENKSYFPEVMVHTGYRDASPRFLVFYETEQDLRMVRGASAVLVVKVVFGDQAKSVNGALEPALVDLLLEGPGLVQQH